MSHELFSKDAVIAGLAAKNAWREQPEDNWTILCIKIAQSLTIECLQQDGDMQFQVAAHQILPVKGPFYDFSLIVQTDKYGRFQFTLTKYAFDVITALLGEQTAVAPSRSSLLQADQGGHFDAVLEGFFEQILESEVTITNQVK